MPHLWTLLGVHLLATMAPGPDFALVTRNSLSGSKRSGFFTVVGIISANAFLLTLLIFGMGALIATSLSIRWLIEAVGATYLIWIGYQSFQSSEEKSPVDSVVLEEAPARFKKDDWSFWRQGFFTSVLNVKAWLYFTAFLAAVLAKTPRLSTKLGFAASLVLISFTWFSIVVVFFSHPRLQKKLLRWRPLLERAIGLILALLGVRIWVEVVAIARNWVSM